MKNKKTKYLLIAFFFVIIGLFAVDKLKKEKTMNYTFVFRVNPDLHSIPIAIYAQKDIKVFNDPLIGIAIEKIIVDNKSIKKLSGTLFSEHDYNYTLVKKGNSFLYQMKNYLFSRRNELPKKMFQFISHSGSKGEFSQYQYVFPAKFNEMQIFYRIKYSDFSLSHLNCLTVINRHSNKIEKKKN